MERYSLGVDLGGTNMRAALVNEAGQLTATLHSPTPVKDGPEETARQLSKMLLELAELSPAPVLGVGIGSPGPLSRSAKMIFQTPNLPGFDSFPLGLRVEEQTKIRVWLDNDAKCAALGEGRFGRAKGKKNYLLLTFGTGVGSGLVVDGKMIYGKSDGACETGHMTLHPGGMLCKCGNRGCLEQYVSALAIERRASEAAGFKVSGPQILDAHRDGTPWAETTLRAVAEDLSLAIASLVNIFDPEMVVFGGGFFTTGGGPLCAWVQEGIKSRCFVSSQKGLTIVASSLGGDAGVLGAASLTGL